MTGDYSVYFFTIFIIFSQDLGDALRATDDPSDWLIGGNGRSNSHVVLHDRLMTDALLGNAPIKAEHSYCTTHGSRESLDDAIGECWKNKNVLYNLHGPLSDTATAVVKCVRVNVTHLTA